MYEDRKCPKCGALNKNLNLRETDGLFVCSNCKATIDTKKGEEYVEYDENKTH